MNIKFTLTNSKNESFRPFESNLRPGSTEQKIAAYQAASRSCKYKCSACDEPLKVYDPCNPACYCDDCFAEISKRINRQKENIEMDPSCLYKEEYVVIDLSKLE